MVKDVQVVFGKAPGSQPIPNDANGHAPMWKKYISQELPYKEVLEVRNAIDMLGFMGMYGTEKIHWKESKACKV